MDQSLAGVALVVGLLAGLVLGGTAVVAAGPVGDAIGSEPSFEETDLRTVQTFDPVCDSPGDDEGVAPDPDVTRTSSVPVEKGRLLSINRTVSVAHPDTTLSVSVDDVGPHRYRLSVRTTPGSEPADCDLVARYNATLNLTRADVDGYTVVVTHDRQLASVLWAETNAAGASASASAGASASGGAAAEGARTTEGQ